MTYKQDLVNTAVKEHGANHHYLRDSAAYKMASQIVGWVVSNRHKSRTTIMTDVEKALKKFKVPFDQLVGYRFVGAHCFNQLDKVDRYGKLIPGKKKKRSSD